MSLTHETLYDGGVERVVLDRPSANLVDRAMVAELRGLVATLRSRPALKLVVLEGAGASFSYGASVKEHLPGEVDAMLTEFHALFGELETLSVPTVAVVRGQCLGGGAELAMWCGRVFAHPSTRIGFPEVKLAVFPPIASLGLSWRTTGSTATRLVTTGEILRADAALAVGLVDEITDDPDAAWRRWFEEHLLPGSPKAIRTAWAAARRPLARALAEDLPALERMYLEDLMSHPDAVEGLTAFIAKRPPSWRLL